MQDSNMPKNDSIEEIKAKYEKALDKKRSKKKVLK